MREDHAVKTITIIDAVKSNKDLHCPFFNDYYEKKSNWDFIEKKCLEKGILTRNQVQVNQEVGKQKIRVKTMRDCYLKYLNTLRLNSLQNKAYSLQSRLSYVIEYQFCNEFVFHSIKCIKQSKDRYACGVMEKAVYIAMIKGKLPSSEVLKVFYEDVRRCIQTKHFPNKFFKKNDLTVDGAVTRNTAKLSNSIDDDDNGMTDEIEVEEVHADGTVTRNTAKLINSIDDDDNGMTDEIEVEEVHADGTVTRNTAKLSNSIDDDDDDSNIIIPPEGSNENKKKKFVLIHTFDSDLDTTISSDNDDVEMSEYEALDHQQSISTEIPNTAAETPMPKTVPDKTELDVSINSCS